MSAAHTPGPWSVQEAFGLHGELCFLQIHPARQNGEAYRGEVASVSDAENIDGISADECAANARLIAAAPLLLKELRRCIRLVDGEVPMTAIAAIKAATGDDA